MSNVLSDIETQMILDAWLAAEEKITEAKAAYDERNKLVKLLRDKGFKSAIYKGLELKLVNNFLPDGPDGEEKLVVFRPVGVCQWEIKTVKPK